MGLHVHVVVTPIGYQARLYDDKGALVFSCSHAHRTEWAAKGCASRARKLMRLGNVTPIRARPQ